MKSLTRAGLLALSVTFSLAPAAVMAETADSRDIQHLVYAGQDSAQEHQAEVAARHFYAFWNTGDEAALNLAIAPTFTDHTLPPGRPQGPEGPATASRVFRQAVPDLKVRVREMIVAGEYVTTNMVFSGHFTGTFSTADGETVPGQGQLVEFIATDLVKVADGKITDNWHIEDNLTLLTQMGLVSAR